MNFLKSILNSLLINKGKGIYTEVSVQGKIFMNYFPPEKYYEACITYHLVNEFRERFDQTLYPISISQIEEHFKGYDFGYCFSCKSFFIQYKRPSALQNDIYSWHINKEQLQIINKQSSMFKIYYALPAFSDMMEWYYGIDHTYFIVAPKLAIYLNDSKGEKVNVIHSTSNALRCWEEIANQFAAMQNNISTITQQKVFTVADIIEFKNSLNDESHVCTWGYLLKEDKYG